jgi:hypothetical protein
MASRNGKGLPLRDWNQTAYDPVTGRSISSVSTSGNTGNHAKSSDNQTPSISGRDKSGSGDPGRNKNRASDLP